MKTRDLTNETFGRLLVVAFDHFYFKPCGQGVPIWKCRCICGTECTARAPDLLSGHKQSCSCLKFERISETQTKHGKSHSSEYAIWNAMHQRCSNQSGRFYKDYGERGIGVCPEWEHFEQFWQDMGPRPSGHTLERIDNSKGYSPQNCKWATRKEQANNTRRNLLIELNGITKNLKQWAEYLNVPYARLRSRYDRNWPVRKLLREYNGDPL